MGNTFGVFNRKEPSKTLFKGSYYQCKIFINATVGFDAFLGGSNWTDYDIRKLRSKLWK